MQVKIYENTVAEMRQYVNKMLTVNKIAHRKYRILLNMHLKAELLNIPKYQDNTTKIMNDYRI